VFVTTINSSWCVWR